MMAGWRLAKPLSVDICTIGGYKFRYSDIAKALLSLKRKDRMEGWRKESKIRGGKWVSGYSYSLVRIKGKPLGHYAI